MQRIIKEQYERTKQILTEKRELLDLIATTLLEVETLDAEQINHLKDHGTLPDRPYDHNGNEIDEDAKTWISEKEDDTVISDSTGAPTDPSVGDLPKETEPDQPLNPIEEKRKRLNKMNVTGMNPACCFEAVGFF